MSTDTRKRRTITMTDRPPVSIVEDEWQIIARGDGDSWTGRPGAEHEQALARNQVDRYTLRVREHDDGRMIVYGVLNAAPAWTGSEDHRGGEILEPGANVVAAIRRVGDLCRLPDSVIRECIADLPAEDI